MTEDRNRVLPFTKASDPLSLPLTQKEHKTFGDRPISVTSHLCLRMNEFIRSFLRKDFSEHKTSGNTKKALGSGSGRGGGEREGGHCKAGNAVRGQCLVTPFQSGLKKPQRAVTKSRTWCGNVTGTQSTHWEQVRQITLELAKHPSLILAVSRRKGPSLDRTWRLGGWCARAVFWVPLSSG